MHADWQRTCNMQDDRARAEALLFFNGKHDFLDEDEAMYASEDVDPAIEELVASVQGGLPALQQQSLQLADGIQVHAMTMSQLTGCTSLATGILRILRRLEGAP